MAADDAVRRASRAGGSAGAGPRTVPIVRPSPLKRRRMSSALVGWGVGAGSPVGGRRRLADDRAPGRANDTLEPIQRRRSRRTSRPAPNDSPAPDAADAESPDMTDEQVGLGRAPPAGSAEPAVELIDDDGQALWASPTSGPPLDLGHLPRRCRGDLWCFGRPSWRPASREPRCSRRSGPPARPPPRRFTQSPSANGPKSSSSRSRSIRPIAVRSERPSSCGWRRAVTTEAWKERLSNPTTAKHADKQYFQAGDRAYYLPEAGSWPAGRHRLAGRNRGADRRRRSATDQRNGAAAGRYRCGSPLHALGRALFHFQRRPDDFRGRARSGSRNRCGDFSATEFKRRSSAAHVDRDLFLELRAYGQADKDPRQLAAHYRAELAELPGAVRNLFGHARSPALWQGGLAAISADARRAAAIHAQRGRTSRGRAPLLSASRCRSQSADGDRAGAGRTTQERAARPAKRRARNRPTSRRLWQSRFRSASHATPWKNR